MKKPLKERYRSDCRFIFYAALVSTLWLLLDSETFLGESLSNFRFQIGIAGLIGAIGQSRKFAISASGAALVLAVQIYEIETTRSFIQSTKQPTNSDGTSYKLLSANILGKTTSPARIDKLIRNSLSEIVVLQEFNKSFENISSLASYPYRIIKFRDDDFGTALFSRYPLIDRSDEFKQALNLNLSAEITTPTGPILILSAHLVPPSTLTQRKMRDQQIQEIITYVSQTKLPILLSGDFNLTPFNERYKNLVRALKLEDMRATLGFTPTWPTFMPPIWIPIDHAFIGRGASLVKIEKGPFIWSDHFPLQITFSLQKVVVN